MLLDRAVINAGPLVASMKSVAERLNIKLMSCLSKEPRACWLKRTDAVCQAMCARPC